MTTASPTTMVHCTSTHHTYAGTAAGGSAPPALQHVTNKQLTVLSKGVTPAKTNKITKLTISNLKAWKEARNQKYRDDQVPDDLLMYTDLSIPSVHL